MSNNKQLKIDFLGIGVQKAGTTWLFNQLAKLPEFDLLPKKELHYFDRSPFYPSPNDLSKRFLRQRIFDSTFALNVLKDIGYSIKNGDWRSIKFMIKLHFSTYSDNWYLSLFDRLKGYKGEITPSYSILEIEDIKDMYRLAPNAKLILMLRNPVERAWSHYRFETRHMKNFSLKNVDYNEIREFIDSDTQSLRSDYMRTLRNFSAVYPKDQILICFFDAVTDNPNALISQIIKFVCGDAPIELGHLKLKDVIHKSRSINCPEKVELYIKEKYQESIRELADAFGGYFSKWYKDMYEEETSNRNKTLSPTIHLE